MRSETPFELLARGNVDVVKCQRQDRSMGEAQSALPRMDFSFWHPRTSSWQKAGDFGVYPSGGKAVDEGQFCDSIFRKVQGDDCPRGVGQEVRDARRNEHLPPEDAFALGALISSCLWAVGLATVLWIAK